MSQADNSVKNQRNLPISSRKPDLHNINAHTKSGESPLFFYSKLSSGNENMDGHTTDEQTDRHKDDQQDTIIPLHYRVEGCKKNLF